MNLLLYFTALLAITQFQSAFSKVFPYKVAEKRCIKMEYYPGTLRPSELGQLRHNLTEKLISNEVILTSTQSSVDAAKLRLNKCMSRLVCGTGKSIKGTAKSDKLAGSCRWPMMANEEVAAISRWLPDCPHYRGFYMKHPFDRNCTAYFGCITSRPFGLYTVRPYSCNSGLMFDSEYSQNCVSKQEYKRRYGGVCKSLPWPEGVQPRIGWTGSWTNHQALNEIFED